MANKKTKQRNRSEGDRYPSGQLKSKHLPKNLGPNEEMQRMRHQLFAGNTNPSLAADFPLDILFARNLITDEQRRAGYRYQQTYWTIFGSPVTRATAYSETIGGDARPTPLSEDVEITRDEKTRIRHEDASAELLQISTAVYRAVQNAAVFLRIPRIILVPMTTRPTDLREVDEIREGLFALADWYGYSNRRAA